MMADAPPHPGRKLRIGIFGMWGMNVPGKQFAGFESAFSEIAPRLVARGHEVLIYCRKGAYPDHLRIPEHRGVGLVYLPSPGGKNFAGLINTLLAVLHAAIFARLDIFFFVNVGMGFHCALARLIGKRVILNVDGLDWRRDKWGPIGKAYFYSAARVAVATTHRLVTDAEAMRRFYLEHFGRDSTMIAYGADIEKSREPERITQFGVVPRDYYLVVSRLIPENSLDIILDGYRRSGSRKRLIVVGSANYESEFHHRLRRLATEDVVFTGHVHDQRTLTELWCNCFAYLHGHSVGGTNPALLRAMGCGCCVVAHDNEFNREVLGEHGIFFPSAADTLAKLLGQLDADPVCVAAQRHLGPKRILQAYTWDRILLQYERLFADLSAIDAHRSEPTASVVEGNRSGDDSPLAGAPFGRPKDRRVS